MRVSSIQPQQQRPQIKRMTQQELQELRMSYGGESPSLSSNNRTINPYQSQSISDPRQSWQPMYPPPQNPNNDRRDQCLQHRAWFWVFGGVFCLILVIAVVAIVLGIVLPMTTAAPDPTASGRMANVQSATEPTAICSNADRGTIVSFKGSTSFQWKLFSYTYVARKTFPRLSFTFETDRLKEFYFDRVSVTGNADPSVELLSNPDFDDSDLNLVGWMISCQSTCSSSSSHIISGSQCYDPSGYCLQIQCKDNRSSITVVSQSFLATLEQTYTIKFFLKQGETDTSFYVDID